MASGFGICIIKFDSEAFVHLVHHQIDIIFPLFFMEYLVDSLNRVMGCLEGKTRAVNKTVLSRPSVSLVKKSQKLFDE